MATVSNSLAQGETASFGRPHSRVQTLGTAKAMTSTSKIRMLPHAGRLICGSQKMAMAGSARMI